MWIAPAMLQLTASHRLWAVIVLIAALVLIVLYYRRTLPPLRIPVKAPLMALRIIAALALFLALADALWSAIRTDPIAHELVILQDRSASMHKADDRDRDRFGRGIQYMGDRVLSRLGERARIAQIPFDSHLWTGDEQPPDSFGTATAIGDVLAETAKRPVEGAPTRAIVILSDGANNRGIEPSKAAAALGVPVIAVGFGRPGDLQARVINAAAPEVVFTGRPFDVNASLQSGSRPERVTIRLSVGERTLDERIVELAGAGARIPVTIPTQIDAPGLHDLRVDLIAADGRVVPEAGRSVFVHALKGRLKILLLGFELNWEYASLKRWLSQQERVELIEHTTGKPQIGGSFPTAADWEGIDVAILLNPSRNELRTFWSPYTAAMSRPGKGTVFLLNERFSGASAETPPAPFEFCRTGLPHRRGEFASEPVATRQNHPLVRLDPMQDWESTRRLWVERPPWASLVVFDTLPANCDVLVRTAPFPDGRDFPVLWSRPLKGGRSVALAGAPIWRWVAQSASEGLATEQYEAFWGNLLRWLTLTDDADRLAIRPDREIYHAGEPIELQGLVFDEAYRFLDRAEVTARIWQEGKDTVSVFLNPGTGDRFVGRLEALPPGTYRYDGLAKVEGAAMPLSGGIFRVETYGLEQQYSSLDETTLRSIARESGGRYYSEDDDPAFLDSLDWAPLVHQRPVEVELGDHWLVLSIFVAALSAEWFVRRRRQLL